MAHLCAFARFAASFPFPAPRRAPWLCQLPPTALLPPQRAFRSDGAASQSLLPASLYDQQRQDFLADGPEELQVARRCCCRRQPLPPPPLVPPATA